MILIVDDENGIREFLRTFLETKKFEVLQAGSAEEALDIWNEHREDIELVITDIVMPGMNGKSLSERLRAEKKSLPVIFMSGYLPEEVAEERLDGPFFKKPFNPLDLLDTVEEALRKSNTGN